MTDETRKHLVSIMPDALRAKFELSLCHTAIARFKESQLADAFLLMLETIECLTAAGGAIDATQGDYAMYYVWHGPKGDVKFCMSFEILGSTVFHLVKLF